MYNVMISRVHATIFAVKKKTVNITYPECVFVDLCLQYVMRLRHIVICGNV
jgi:hypothetical protein